MTISSQTHHHMDYIELSHFDLNKAKNFYAQAFGWVFNDYGPTYAGIQAPNSNLEVGGFQGASDPVQNAPLIILYSENLEKSKTKILEAGGKVTQDVYSFPGGRRFHFQDPSGNELAVWSQNQKIDD
jgi:predicted enzyme related to lactoylglutathione lyase